MSEETVSTDYQILRETIPWLTNSRMNSSSQTSEGTTLSKDPEDEFGKEAVLCLTLPALTNSLVSEGKTADKQNKDILGGIPYPKFTKSNEPTLRVTTRHNLTN